MPVLTPALALRYLAELEPALEAVAVATAEGKTLAGDPSLADLLAAEPAGSRRLLSARSTGYLVIALARPDGLLEELARHDLEAVARELG